MEQAFGAYPVEDAKDLATEIGGHPWVWTDGRLEPYPIAGIAVAGARVYLPAPEFALHGAAWEKAEEYGDARVERCRSFND